MANNTYVALDKKTITAGVSSIEFTSIPSNYTDLVIVASDIVAASSFPNIGIRFNGDTASNYSSTILEGTGSAVRSARKTSVTITGEGDNVSLGGSSPSTIIYNIMNYANTTTYKSFLIRANDITGGTYSGLSAVAGVWRKTPEAINAVTLTLSGINFAVGGTFSLYGIKSESASSTPKATGGTIYSDATYFYHIFGASGTFTPTSTITADAVVVGGGGGGGWNNGGGGGGGEIATNTGTSYTSGTGVTVTIGAGGTFATSTSSSGANGGQTSLVGVTNGAGGGGGGTSDASSPNNAGKTGGSGGGGSANGTAGGTASGSNTNAGGAGFGAADNYMGGGGGGATSAGTAGVSGDAGNGGEGKAVSTIFSGLNLSGINILSSGGGGGGYLASGTMQPGLAGTNGGLGAIENSSRGNSNPTAGVPNSGSGGGGGAYTGVNSRNGAAGGSGIVIIRYLKA